MTPSRYDAALASQHVIVLLTCAYHCGLEDQSAATMDLDGDYQRIPTGSIEDRLPDGDGVVLAKRRQD